MARETKNSAIASFLEDLTHLQIDTIIKSGMTATEPPERVEELLYSLHSKYVRKLEVLLDRNELMFSFDKQACKTFENLDEQLKRVQTFMDTNNKRMEEPDYIIFLRMSSFCNLIKEKSRQYTISGISTSGSSIYTEDLIAYNNFRLEGVSPRDMAKLKRFHDLGTERVVMQTRVGLDGDVVSRIEENFAGNPKQLLVDIHEKHTKLSMDYWNSLISTVINIVGKIFDFKK